MASLEPAIDRVVAGAAGRPLRYASILAGGACSAACWFCVGRGAMMGPARAGTDWATFLAAVRGRVEPRLSLSGVDSDPALLPDVGTMIATAQGLGFTVTLHTNGIVADTSALGSSDRVTVSCHSFDPATFERAMGRPGAVLGRIRRAIAEQAPRGAVKLSATWLPENADEIRSGRWFDAGRELGVDRFVVRRLAGGGPVPVLPAGTTLVREHDGQQVFDLDGAEVTVWDYGIANARVAAVLYWPDGSVRGVEAWSLGPAARVGSTDTNRPRVD